MIVDRDVFEREQNEAFAEIRRSLRGHDGRIGVVLTRMTISAAMAIPALRPSVLTGILHAGISVGWGEPLQCFCCAQSWTVERKPGAVITIEVLDPPHKLLAFVCEACSPDDAGLMKAAKRDLGIGNITIMSGVGHA